MKANVITKPGVYLTREGRKVRITHVDGIQAYSRSLDATWNTKTGRHDCSQFDVVAMVETVDDASGR